MWIHISKLARDSHLPEDALTALAMRDQRRYGVIMDRLGPKIDAAQARMLTDACRAWYAKAETA